MPESASDECDPGSVAVKPRIGSVSSCSGEGSASGDISTRAAAHRSVAAVVCASEFNGALLGVGLTPSPGDGSGAEEVENELRIR